VAVKVLLFDIDGTLVLTGGAGARAMARAFEEVFGIQNGFGTVPMNGRTDFSIVTDAAARHEVRCDPASLQRFHDIYIEHLAREVHLPGPRKGMMPGVGPLLDALAPRNDVYLALLTGNFESGARIKLEYFDLWRYFACGAFGDAAPERNGLLDVALSRIRAHGGPEVARADVVIVGDTPLDVAVAVAGGTRSVAVATGTHDLAALQSTEADAVLPDLSDLPAVLDALGLTE
jgi:phosphoglycolate phosphatase